MKYLIILSLLLSGCFSTKIKSRSDSAPPSGIINTFDNIDSDSNGTIDRLEFYQSASQVNSYDPSLVLIIIIAAVFICCSITFRFSSKK